MTDTPETHYADSPGGQIAYQVFGDGPTDLVHLSGATSNLDVGWEFLPAAEFLRRLASFTRLILLDRRGNGLSDRLTADQLPTWEEWADDIGAVLDTVGSERAAVFANLTAGPMGMVFAASHPARVSTLVLANTAARWVSAPDYPIGLSQEVAELVVQAYELGWGTEDHAVSTSPSAAEDPNYRRWLAKLQRASATPAAVGAQIRALFEGDFRSVLPAIRVPTLVLTKLSAPLMDPAHGRYLADHISGARLVELPGSDMQLYGEDPDAVLDVVEEFLTGVPPLVAPDRVLATVLFTDLVDSTRQAVEVGDRAWRRLLDRHDDTIRAEVARHRGRLVSTAGDGALAVFDAPGRAVRCALGLVSSTASLGLTLRAGVHTAELELRSDDVGGIAVHIGARVATLAGPEEVLVSSTVKDLVAGSGITFVDRGEHQLKGVPGTWKLYRALS